MRPHTGAGTEENGGKLERPKMAREAGRLGAPEACECGNRGKTSSSRNGLTGCVL